jgi:hypothetical protein
MKGHMVQFRRNYVHGRDNYGPRVRTRVAWALLRAEAGIFAARFDTGRRRDNVF